MASLFTVTKNQGISHFVLTNSLFKIKNTSQICFNWCNFFSSFGSNWKYEISTHLHVPTINAKINGITGKIERVRTTGIERKGKIQRNKTQGSIEGKKNSQLFLFVFAPHLILGDHFQAPASVSKCPLFVVVSLFYWQKFHVSKFWF